MKTISKSLFHFTLRLAVAVALIWLVVGPTRLVQACRLFSGSKPWPLLWSLLITVFAILVKTTKWQVFLKTAGVHLGYWKLFRYYLISCFFNVFLPSSVGGDFKRMIDVTLETPKRAAAIGSILADRGTGLYCLMVYCLFVALFRWEKIGGSWISGTITLLTGGITLGAPIAVCVIGRIGPKMAGWGKWSEKFARVLQSLALQVRHPVGLAVGLSLSLLLLLLSNVAVWCLAQALSIPASWEAIFVSVPIVFALASLPVTINGIGIREGGFIYFLGLYGVAPESAVAISLGILALLIALGLLGGILFVAIPARKVSD